MKNDTVTCEVCGKQKSKSDMSKSYTHRCKECVAAHTRQVRADAKKDTERTAQKEDMTFRKAVVKDTGETVLVRMCHEPLTVRTAKYETPEGRMFPMFALEYEKEIDWEQRRYEVAKSAMVGLMAGHNAIYDADKLASVAMTYADALIKELQKA